MPLVQVRFFIERLSLAVPHGCLRFVIVVFPDHTYLLFLVRNPIKCAIEISKFRFDLSPFHQVTISLKGYTRAVQYVMKTHS